MPTNNSLSKRRLLRTGEILRSNEYLSSANDAYYLVMQPDGNLCKYFGADPAHSSGLLWSALKEPLPEGDYFTVMRDDGTLCIYKGKEITEEGLAWSSFYKPQPAGEYFAMIGDDGDICIYKGTGLDDNRGITWKSTVIPAKPKPPGSRGPRLTPGDYIRSTEFMTPEHSRFFLVMQGDGNLCEYYGTDAGHNQGYLWGTMAKDTRKENAFKKEEEYFAILRQNGNFQVCKGTGPDDEKGVIWSAIENPDTEADGAYYLELKDDGGLMVWSYMKEKVIWDSGVRAVPKPTPLDMRKPENFILRAGEIMKANSSLVSHNRAYHFVMQFDGNLGGHHGADPAHSLGAYWNSTYDQPEPGEYFAMLQYDGRLCVYKGSGPDDKQRLIWSSFEESLPEGDYYAIVDDDGNLKVYSGTEPGDSRQMWQTQEYAPPKALPQPSPKGFILKTEQVLSTNEYLSSSDASFHLVMQPSGNLGAYYGADPFHNKGLIWENSGAIAEHGDFYALMQGDGNLCILKGPGTPYDDVVWTALSESQPHGDYFALIEDDGNVCIYRGKDWNSREDLIWQSKSHAIAKPACPVDVADFAVKNPGLKISAFDFYDQKMQQRLNWKNTELELLLTYQRLLRITKDELALANLLFDCGIRSAQDIIHKNNFIDVCADWLLLQRNDACRELMRVHEITKGVRGYTYDIASWLFTNAACIVQQSDHLLATVKSISASSYFDGMKANPVNGELKNYFRSLPGYDEIFSNNDAYQHDKERSFSGPLAYLVDLFRITEKGIVKLDPSLPSRKWELPEQSGIEGAINSVQLYLQRCRLNLEENVVIDKKYVDETWWEWIMDYSVWETNRHVFMYPENYTDPELRKSKTVFFNVLEDELKRYKLDNKSAEEAFARYFAGLEKLATLQYVDALNCMVNNTDTLFLFARTHIQPQEYYFISKADDVWSEWKKIDAPVHAKYITPVYAFNKLFIFWTELKKTEEQDQTSDDKMRRAVVSKVSIHYTFLDVSGKWSATQTVMADEVINIESEKSLYEPFDKELFSEENSWWFKVGAIAVKPDSIKVASENNREEKIFIHYGPLLDSGAWPEGTTAKTDKKLSGAFSDFNKTIVHANDLMLEAQKCDHKGFVPILKTILIDNDLDVSFFTDKKESVLFLHSPVAVPTFQLGQYEDRHTKYKETFLYEEFSSNPYYSNYTQGSLNIQGSSSDYRLFKSVSATSSSIISVQNNPGMFLFSEQGETFIVGCDRYQQMTEAQETGDLATFRKINPEYLESQIGFLDAEKAGWLYNLLLYLQIVDASGFVNFPASYTIQSLTKKLVDSKKMIEKEISEKELDFVNLISQCDCCIEKYSEDPDDIMRGNPCMRKVTAAKKEILRERERSLEPLMNIKRDREKLDEFVKLQNQHQVLYWLLRGSSTNVGIMYRDAADHIELYDLRYTISRISTNAFASLSGKLASGGLGALLSLSSQQAPTESKRNFDRLKVDGMIQVPKDGSFLKAGDQVDFNGPYGDYYRELFFHVPLLIAELLSNNNQFSAAQKWLSFIFDPTVPKATDHPFGNVARYWKFLPLHERTLSSISEIFRKKEILSAYEKNPLDADVLTQLHVGAYEKNVLMKYIDNLLEWGDNLSAQETQQSKELADKLYQYASGLLGPKPQPAEDAKENKGITYEEFRELYNNGISSIPEYLIHLENARGYNPENITSENVSNRVKQFSFYDAGNYFSIPENEKFISYWDKVEGRLQDTAGVYEQDVLPLLE